ncbi:MAG: T9SS type A sorting domain-containing protein [Bacteroidota bacterium]
MTTRCLTFIGLFALTAALSIAPLAQPTSSRGAEALPSEATLAPSTGASNFGYAVSVSEDRALVGALASGHGKAYVYRRDAAATWVEEAEFVPSDGSGADQFGHGVALNEERALVLVGAPLHDAAGDNSGAAYVYRRSETEGWVLSQKLFASDAAANDQFGNSVALHGWRALVLANNGEAAYVFAEAQGEFIEEAILPAPAAKGYWSSAHLSDSLAIIGAPDYGGHGAAFTYRLLPSHDWVAEDTLMAPSPSSLDAFGWSVALSGERAVIGAIGNDEGAVESGAVYVFDRSPSGVWSLEATLKRAIPQASGRMGFSVAVEANHVLAGAITSRGHSGEVVLFESSGPGEWREAATLVTTATAPGDQYGVSVALDGDRALVGAVLDGQGTAHAFDLSTLVATPQTPDITGELTVGPNPARDAVTVFIARQPASRAAHIEVIDVLGRVVERRQLRTTATELEVSLSTRHIAPGVYTVRLIEGGVNAGTARLVIAR